MRYTLIKGSFSIIGTQPDGDTVRFQPENTAFIDDLPRQGRPPAWNNDRTQINIRFEGIDALETHFRGARQNQRWGDEARDFMLRQIGFANVNVRGVTVASTDNNPAQGFVLAKTIDSFGRVIAFVYAGEMPQSDGEPVFVDRPLLSRSVNAEMLVEGLAYPAFYSSLPCDLRDHLAAINSQARNDGAGLWPHAVANVDKPWSIPDLDALQELVIWPKLFRRLSNYFRQDNNGLAGFDAWLREDPINRDDLVMLPDRELGNIHDVIEIDGDQIRMLFLPEDLVILPENMFDTTRPTVSLPVRIIAALANPAERTESETVTLLNSTPDVIDLSTLQLRDRAGQRQSLKGNLGSGDCIRIDLTSLRLNNDGDTIALLNSDGESIDCVDYNKRQGGQGGWTIVF